MRNNLRLLQLVNATWHRYGIVTWRPWTKKLVEKNILLVLGYEIFQWMDIPSSAELYKNQDILDIQPGNTDIKNHDQNIKDAKYAVDGNNETCKIIKDMPWPCTHGSKHAEAVPKKIYSIWCTHKMGFLSSEV